VDLAGRAALVTGARRIGAAVAEALAERGADVALSYFRSRDAVEAAAAVVRRRGRRAAVIQADLARPEEAARLVDEAARALGRLDILVNMASAYAAVPFERLDARAWEEALAVDARAAYLCAIAAVPYMRRAGGGRIVNFSDWVAASGRPRYRDYLPYYVAKRAVIGLTEALALELAPDNILVNAVAPGPIVPPDGATSEEQEAVRRATPLGRWGGPGEIVKAVVALLETDFVTGEVVRVDGGRHLR
jgi:NAD(P)-dependent dehydrogenase (short-subunit alcohol dehydrogenase family)